MASSYYHLAAAPSRQPHPSPAQPQQAPISITICGDGGCGKSSITLRLVRSQWTSEYDPTVEDNYTVTRRVDGVAYHLSLTDTAGQEEYRGMWASSGLRADAFLLVYDITSRESLDALEYFNDLIDMESDTRRDKAARLLSRRRQQQQQHQHQQHSKKTRSIGSSEALREKTRRGSGSSDNDDNDDDDDWSRAVPPVKMVAANKCDLQEDRRVPAAMGLDWARRRGCGFMETSARLEVNVEETFALLVRRVAEHRRLAALGIVDYNADMNARGMTKPLTPPPLQLQQQQQQQKNLASPGADAALGEKRRLGIVRFWKDGWRWRRGVGEAWKRLRCW